MSFYKYLSDEQLLSRLRHDDQRAFSELYDRYWRKMFAVAVHRLNDSMDAEECVQDVFSNVWCRRKELEINHTLNTYLATAIKYRAIRLLDRQYKKEKTQLYVAEQFSHAADASFIEKELREGIEISVKALPEKCQLIYRLSREQGHSHKQIARQLSISEKAVENQITKAIKVIRRGLASSLPAPLIICFISNLLSKF